MWFKRDFLKNLGGFSALPVKVLKGPRQVGKTSLLEHLARYRTLYFDDLAVRRSAQENPRLFFDQFQGPLLLDEATLAPEIFPELKRRVDASRKSTRENPGKPAEANEIDVWITGSNQTLLQKSVRESLAGRASYFDLNTLSIHELGDPTLSDLLFKGGWPALHAHPELKPGPYLNDLISTFIEKDIVSAAGIEKRAAFSRTLQLCAARVSQLFNASDIAKSVGVDVTTVQSWVSIAEQNGILRSLRPYHTNLNKRLIKSPKVYFEDVALATRFQGWTEFEPLFFSPVIGQLMESIALAEIVRFFQNRGEKPEIFYLRNKERVEIDFLIQLPNQRFIAAEVKSTPEDMTPAQQTLLDSIGVNVVEKWVLSPQGGIRFARAESVAFREIWGRLEGAMSAR
jgi:predicted AAA+ superfamily ATPase